MNFLFVDRILDLVPGQHVKGIKHVTEADTYIRRNDHGEIILFPAIVGEALGQLGAWCVMAANGFSRRPVAGILQTVRLIGDAKLGDTILLDTIIDSCDEDATQYHSVASVRGKPIIELIHAVGPFLPMETFSEASVVKQQFAMINRPDPNWQDESPQALHPIKHDGELHFATGVFADHITEWIHGEKIVAVKKISLLADYFPDHFALKPVFPLSLLLETKLHLVRLFLADLAKNSTPLKIHTIQRIKTNAFIQPGDSIIITLTCQNKTADSCQFQISTELDHKRICSITVLCGVENG